MVEQVDTDEGNEVVITGIIVLKCSSGGSTDALDFLQTVYSVIHREPLPLDAYAFIKYRSQE